MVLVYKKEKEHTPEFYNKLSFFCYSNLFNGKYFPLLNGRHTNPIITEFVERIHSDNRNKLQFSFSKFLSERNDAIIESIKSNIGENTTQIVTINTGFNIIPYNIDAKNKRIKWFYVESGEILEYLEKLMCEEKPKSNLSYVASCIADGKLIEKLVDNGFKYNKKTLWVIDGLLSNMSDIQMLSGLLDIIKNRQNNPTLLMDIPIMDPFKMNLRYIKEGLKAIHANFSIPSNNIPKNLFNRLGFEINSTKLVTNETNENENIFSELILNLRRSDIFDFIRE